MKVIIRASLMERIRRRELYIIFAVGVLMILLTCTGEGSLSVNGEVLTGFENRMMIFQIMANFFSCILAVVLSMNTIPNEYERRNSHLVWIRGISQRKYHGSLCIANSIVCMMVLLVFYVMLAVFVLINGQAGLIPRLLPAYLITGLNCLFVSVLTSALSIIAPAFIAGTAGIMFVILGVFHSLLSLAKNIFGGFGGRLLGAMLKVVPDLHGMQDQAYRYILGQEPGLHKILAVVFATYIAGIGILVFRRKEA